MSSENQTFVINGQNHATESTKIRNDSKVNVLILTFKKVFIV